MRFFFGFVVLYTCTILYLKRACWRDPTSIFFQPGRAHTPDYSTTRLEQANSYIDEVLSASPVKWNPSSRPRICVGAASVQREGISYLKSTIGSLQEGLDQRERESLYFVVLLAHTNQTRHQEYAQPWLSEAADRLPTYQDDQDRLSLAKTLELDGSHNPKAKFDYAIVLEECAKVNPLFTMIVEDDVVALDGWYHRTLEALEEAYTLTTNMGRTSFLYLRLFYYEALQGWNSESWLLYTRNCVAIVLIEVVLIAVVRHYYGTRASRRASIEAGLIAQLLVYTLLCIVLFFGAGGSCMAPKPKGVSLMPKYACCGQGLVFPQDQVNDHLLPFFRANRNSTLATDSFIEDYADRYGELRWAVTPALLQHVGGKSSHGVARNRYGDMTADGIFNFEFETNTAEALYEEHHAVIGTY